MEMQLSCLDWFITVDIKIDNSTQFEYSIAKLEWCDDFSSCNFHELSDKQQKEITTYIDKNLPFVITNEYVMPGFVWD